MIFYYFCNLFFIFKQFNYYFIFYIFIDKLNIVRIDENKSPIIEITIKSTITTPARVASVEMSSFPLLRRIWPITAVKIPIAAILKMISTSNLHHLLFDFLNYFVFQNIMMAKNSPATTPSFIESEPYFFCSSSHFALISEKRETNVWISFV